MEETDSLESEIQQTTCNVEFMNNVKRRFSKLSYPKPLSGPPTKISIDTEPEDDSDVYNFDHKYRGLAIIINNEKFHHPLYDNREGSQKDKHALNNSLQRLGFHVEIFNDVTVQQMLLLAQAGAKFYGHQEADCFAFAILTHGEEVEKDRDDEMCSKTHVLIDGNGDKVETEKIVSCFNDENCPSLRNKPRLFFIQACRGKKLDDGTHVKELSNGELVCVSPANPPNPENPQGASASGAKKTVQPGILYPHCLIMYASPPGHLAWRRTSTGSWFIQELCKFLDNEGLGEKSFVRGLVSVCRKVALEYESSTVKMATSGKKGMPVLESQLLNDIFMTKHSRLS